MGHRHASAGRWVIPKVPGVGDIAAAGDAGGEGCWVAQICGAVVHGTQAKDGHRKLIKAHIKAQALRAQLILEIGGDAGIDTLIHGRAECGQVIVVGRRVGESRIAG